MHAKDNGTTARHKERSGACQTKYRLAYLGYDLGYDVVRKLQNMWNSEKGVSGASDSWVERGISDTIGSWNVREVSQAKHFKGS